MDNIILIGFMGCGKSSIGRTLASRGYSLVDTDEYIEARTGTTIKNIFATKGEEYFRQLETDAIEDLLDTQKNNMVIAVGGGLPIKEQNRKLLKKLGHVIYLTADVGTLVNRLKGDDKRPLLQSGTLEDKINSLMRERKFIYESVADVKISTDNKSFTAIADEIMEQIQ